MKQRALGRTGLRVSEIGFGTGDNAGLMMKADRGERLAAIARALDAGITYFDTSPDYGKGVAEENLGDALAELGARDAIVATKIELFPDDLGDVGGAVRRSVDASLRRLRRERVEVLMVHNPPRMVRDAAAAFWFPLTPADLSGEVFDALARIRDAGKAAHFGFTCENAEAAAVREVLASGNYAVINAWYNLVNPTGSLPMPDGMRFGRDYENYGGIIGDAAAAGVAVAAIRPLAGGALASAVAVSGAAGRHPNAGGLYSRRPESFEREARRGRMFAFLERPGRSLARAAFRFTLMNPDIATVVCGASDRAQLDELLASADDPPLTDTELSAVRAVYAAGFHEEPV